MFANNSYNNFALDQRPMKEGNKAFIRVDQVNTGSYPIRGNTTFVCCVGPRNSFRNHPSEFGANEVPLDTWDFDYKNANKSSFALVLFRKKLFGGDEEIGEVELRLSSFQPNTVVTENIKLQSPRNKYFNVSVKLSVHICDDGSFPFDAPAGKLLENPVIPHRTTYYN